MRPLRRRVPLNPRPRKGRGFVFHPPHFVVPKRCLGMRPAKRRLANLLIAPAVPLIVIPEFSFRPPMTPALSIIVGGMKISGIPPRQRVAPPPVVPKLCLGMRPREALLRLSSSPPDSGFIPLIEIRQAEIGNDRNIFLSRRHKTKMAIPRSACQNADSVLKHFFMPFSGNHDKGDARPAPEPKGANFPGG